MPNIKCGHCPETHHSVDEVLVCASKHGYKWARRTPAPAPQPAAVRTLRPVKPTEVRREANRSQLIADIRKAGERVPASYYALRNKTNTGNDIAFYSVSKGENGSTYVKLLLSDEEHKLSWERQLNVLVRIGADVAGSLALYGLTTKRCGHCHRRLTRQESRDRGYGPKCAANLGIAV
jgi:hypothetical protein